MLVIKRYILKILYSFAIVLYLSNFSYADDKETYNASTKEVNNIIQEYKKYLSSVNPNVRKEIVEYRRSIAQINKKKIQCYEQLSQQAQEYLKQQQLYKKKLLSLLNNISNQNIEETAEKTGKAASQQK